MTHAQPQYLSHVRCAQSVEVRVLLCDANARAVGQGEGFGLSACITYSCYFDGGARATCHARSAQSIQSFQLCVELLSWGFASTNGMGRAGWFEWRQWHLLMSRP